MRGNERETEGDGGEMDIYDTSKMRTCPYTRRVKIGMRMR
jgi:hypothetical protein